MVARKSQVKDKVGRTGCSSAEKIRKKSFEEKRREKMERVEREMVKALK